MPSWHAWLVFATASLAILAVPGPSVVYLTTRTLAQGRRAGWASVIGVELGTLVHVAAAATGISAIVASSKVAFAALSWLGIGYLIRLAIGALRGAKGGSEPTAASAASAIRIAAQGFVVEAMNPKAALFFVSFLPQFIDPSAGDVAVQALALGCLYVTLAFVVDGAFVTAAGAAARRSGSVSSVALKRVTAGVYLLLAIAATTATA